MIVLRWIARRIWNSQVGKYRLVSRIATAFAVVRWIQRRRTGTVGSVQLARGERLVVGVENTSARVDKVPGR
ncbi:MAG: hypothetical protein FJW53_02425 [Actinobacteria bacterium]|nr:hypothetical protein [Actinomycetota bacterium]